eukprot:5467919-Prymnesium_polylepis.1
MAAHLVAQQRAKDGDVVVECGVAADPVEARVGVLGDQALESVPEGEATRMASEGWGWGPGT